MKGFYRARDEAWLPLAQANIAACGVPGLQPPLLTPWESYEASTADA